MSLFAGVATSIGGKRVSSLMAILVQIPLRKVPILSVTVTLSELLTGPVARPTIIASLWHQGVGTIERDSLLRQTHPMFVQIAVIHPR